MKHPSERGVHYRLCIALSIVQAHLLTKGMEDDAESLFGNMYVPGVAMEEAAKLISDVLGDVEEL